MLWVGFMTYISHDSLIFEEKLNALACGVFSVSERLLESCLMLAFILKTIQLQGQHQMESSVGILVMVP